MAKLVFGQPPEVDGEEWRQLPVAGLWVSSEGRVWVIGRGPTKTSEAPGGYQMVAVRGVNRGKPVGVHRLVAHAFHGECPDGNCVDHIDGDPSNNRPGNLQYVTPAENTRLHWKRLKETDPVVWQATRKHQENERLLRGAQARHEERQRILEQAALELFTAQMDEKEVR